MEQLPVKKVKVVIPITFHKKQIEADNECRFMVLEWGRRTGKSTFTIVKTLMRAIHARKNGRYWIVAPTYKQAKNIFWRDLVGKYIPQELVKRKNESELIIELVTGDVIELKGADNEDSLRGAGISGVILDEYAFMKPMVWDRILRPMIVDSGGWAIFISTPNGFDHFHEMCIYSQEKMAKGDKNWFYSHATTYDNPFIDDSELDELKATTPDDVFDQEYLAIPTKKAGLVYKEFDKETHVIKIERPDYEWAKYVSIDFGQTNPTAVLFIGVDANDNIFVYDEIYRSNMFTSELASLIKAKQGPYMITSFYGDQAAAQSIRDLQEYGIHVHGVQKRAGTVTEDYFRSGIEKVRGYLKIQEGTGKPKIFIAAHCTNLIREFESYSWKELPEGATINKPERPDKSFDHCMDALRYFIYMHRKPIDVKEEERRYDPITGRPMA